MHEAIGLAGTLFILFAFTFTDQRKIRIYDGIGAALFVLYGTLTRTYSTVILNAALIAVHIYKLRSMKRRNAERGIEGDRERILQDTTLAVNEESSTET